jgi:osmotically-inducible protein OsmY
MNGKLMQTRIFKSLIGTAALSTLIVTGLAGCSTTPEGDRTAGQVMDDKHITESVKKALESDPTYKFTDVRVDSYKGVVQLSGFVDNPDQKKRADELAQKSQWVREVVDNIALKPKLELTPTGKAKGERTDESATSTNTPPVRTTNP